MRRCREAEDLLEGAGRPVGHRLQPRMSLKSVTRSAYADDHVTAGTVLGLPALEDEGPLEARARTATDDGDDARARGGGEPRRGRNARSVEPVGGEVAPGPAQRDERPCG